LRKLGARAKPLHGIGVFMTEMTAHPKLKDPTHFFKKYTDQENIKKFCSLRLHDY